MSVTVAPDTLTDFGAACYEALGVPPQDARLVADSLVQADLWGHTSHGVMRLFWYGARLRSGATRPDVALDIPAEPAALTSLDGGDGIGQAVTRAAMLTAIRAARRHGIGAVSVRNSGHFGTAMYFTRMAAEAGCLGYLTTNASPAMAPWGGREKRIGTNPWSWAAPAGRYPPFMLDMATTAVARGKLYAARAAGERIPLGWAMDESGRPTDDPAAGIAGTILPMAGHKGYGIALVSDILSGVLSGGSFGASITGPYMPDGRSGACHFALVIDIAACRPLPEFEADMERLIDQLKSTPRADGTDEIFYPGEIEARSDARLRRDGIALPDSVAEDLAKGASELGIATPF